ncbi:hypothetical protein CU102_22840 [Phyllobacterium brassicacearum]|uniref:HPr kinase/phosphorylase C-terminal domain-containing protein n=1 Tax=Phyllobacterium brassicacearum TaxID=314235 RepID=A0A2P7BBQ6_9HYPH|nr:HPr kinase/phosphatase C-terminal domain-containing protein [Phyllobacterium brassicacearum]PSH63852.1 hypothetical protein CU102_22840 [Phyllobacterium brassicacearum]TDQ20077.1 HPr serine kinase-like protein [Phyllobacterium brassicacearum]
MIDGAGQLAHATAVVVGDRGILIIGPSGSGKSSVARSLIDRALAKGTFAAVVSDDQCQLQAVSGRLICTVPAALRGGLEVRGSGLHAVDHEDSAVMHLVVELVEPDRAVRFADETEIQLEGVSIAYALLPKREIESACRAIEARLFTPPWKKR